MTIMDCDVMFGIYAVADQMSDLMRGIVDSDCYLYRYRGGIHV